MSYAYHALKTTVSEQYALAGSIKLPRSVNVYQPKAVINFLLELSHRLSADPCFTHVSVVDSTVASFVARDNCNRYWKFACGSHLHVWRRVP